MKAWDKSLFRLIPVIPLECECVKDSWSAKPLICKLHRKAGKL